MSATTQDSPSARQGPLGELRGAGREEIGEVSLAAREDGCRFILPSVEKSCCKAWGRCNFNTKRSARLSTQGGGGGDAERRESPVGWGTGRSTLLPVSAEVRKVLQPALANV